MQSAGEKNNNLFNSTFSRTFAPMNTPLPNIPTKILAIKLRPSAEKMLKQKHPWVFSDSVVKINAEGNSGDIAIIYDTIKNKFLALGLYDPDSPIRIKIIQFSKPAKINEDWFQNKIKIAFDKRAKLLATDTNSYRLIFGENDSLPGVIADVYDKVLVLKLYSAIWYPYLEQLLPALIKTSNCETVVLRTSRQLQQRKKKHNLFDGQVLYGKLENEVVLFKEHGIHFSANVIHGHKTGYFLDHRANRKRVGELAKGKTVLDVFSYAGGFTVHALVGGAKEVTSLDISGQALEMAKENVALNPHKGTHHIIKEDAFKALQELIAQKIKFDIVVIDPPSFAKRQSEIVGALHSYQRLTRLGKQLVKKGGTLVMASCSSRIKADDFFEIVENNLSSFQIIEKTTHDTDHPISFPEGAYLKCGYYQL